MSLIGVLKPKFNIKNINTAELGWVRPDKSIAFQSSLTAQKYAKKTVIRALKNETPFEKGVLYKDNVILAEINGGNFQIELDGKLPKNNFSGGVFVHGHPNISKFGTTPVSLEDYLAFLGLKLRKMVAYNGKGEYSCIENPSSERFKFLPKKIKNFFNFLNYLGNGSTVVSEYAKMWASLFPEELQKPVEQLLHSNLDNGLLADKKLAEQGTLVRFNSAIMNSIKAKTLELLKNSDTPIKAIDSFWKSNAKRLGYKYSTNFSNLNE